MSHITPRLYGAGMLNSYKIAQVGMRIKQACAAIVFTKRKECVRRFLKSSDTYRFFTENLEGAKGLFPKCFGEIRSNTPQGCEERREGLEILRKAALLTSDPTLHKGLSCIYRVAGFFENARYHELLSYTNTAEDFNLMDYAQRLSNDEIVNNILARPGGHHNRDLAVLVFNRTSQNSNRFKLFKEPAWAFHSDLLVQLIHRREAVRNIASEILPLDHWMSRSDIIRQVIKTGEADDLVVQYVLKREDSVAHPDLVLQLLQKPQTDSMDQMIRYLFRFPHWKNHPRFESSTSPLNLTRLRMSINQTQ